MVRRNRNSCNPRNVSRSRSRTPPPPPPGMGHRPYSPISPQHFPGAVWTGDYITTDREAGILPEFKRIVTEYDPKTRKWSNPEEIVDSESEEDDNSVSFVDPYGKFCFIFRRQIKNHTNKEIPPSIEEFIEIKSYYLRKLGMDIIGNRSGISWNASYLSLQPTQVLAYVPEFRDHVKKIKAYEEKTEDDELTISHTETLISFLESEYTSDLAELEDLALNKEISFTHLYALFKPGRLYVTQSSITGAPQIVRLLTTWTGSALTVESLDSATSSPIASNGVTVNKNPSPGSGLYFWKPENISLNATFFGRVKTTTLNLYPLEDHPDLENFKERMIFRGRKWRDLLGIHLKQYEGPAYSAGRTQTMLKDRVMIDRASYETHTGVAANNWGATPVPADDWAIPPPNNGWNGTQQWQPPPQPMVVPGPTPNVNVPKGIDDDLLLAPSHVYGFAFTDKVWYIFLVEKLGPVTWDPRAFEQISMDMERKALLQSLVEFHNKGTSFRDIVARKGRGLVVNLFGPPGTGKTLTAEAISEYVRKPLYSVTSGDLGEYSSTLSQNLNRIFTLAGKWDAIVLLDEADIFLEARSVNDIMRNGMVSVFLKELEYFEGIIFLTTNRIETFDKAFQSRIHVSLKYEPLTFRSRREVWVSLLQRAGFNTLEKMPLTEKELDTLANAPKNGREIRNIVRTAEAIAASRNETLGYRHLTQVKDVGQAFEEMGAGTGTPSFVDQWRETKDGRTTFDKLILLLCLVMLWSVTFLK